MQFVLMATLGTRMGLISLLVFAAVAGQKSRRLTGGIPCGRIFVACLLFAIATAGGAVVFLTRHH